MKQKEKAYLVHRNGPTIEIPRDQAAKMIRIAHESRWPMWKSIRHHDEYRLNLGSFIRVTRFAAKYARYRSMVPSAFEANWGLELAASEWGMDEDRLRDIVYGRLEVPNVLRRFKVWLRANPEYRDLEEFAHLFADSFAWRTDVTAVACA